ncbi:hypothetical protein GCM10007028_11480 [Algibacter mikhailovii]|uniref:Uncharacterized protein n=1 Tax=Algibacter mikhailovii TaxID=425498 RepID=A0A918QWB9_9FLAO|nr:hypothetical protein GCM10007028_11480 [Algibacter mikhailovii]
MIIWSKGTISKLNLKLPIPKKYSGKYIDTQTAEKINREYEKPLNNGNHLTAMERETKPIIRNNPVNVL